jgi:hypothetical protein
VAEEGDPGRVAGGASEMLDDERDLLLDRVNQFTAAIKPMDLAADPVAVRHVMEVDNGYVARAGLSIKAADEVDRKDTKIAVAQLIARAGLRGVRPAP